MRGLFADTAQRELLAATPNGRQEHHASTSHGICATILSCLQHANVDPCRMRPDGTDDDSSDNRSEIAAQRALGKLVDAAAAIRAAHRLIARRFGYRHDGTYTTAQALARLWPSGPSATLEQLNNCAYLASLPEDGIDANAHWVIPDRSDDLTPIGHRRGPSLINCQEPALCGLLAWAAGSRPDDPSGATTLPTQEVRSGMRSAISRL